MAKRTIVVGDPTSDELVDRDEVIAKLMEVEATGHNFGGKFNIGPVQRPFETPWGEKEFRTVAWVINWDSFIPPVKDTDGSSV